MDDARLPGEMGFEKIEKQLGNFKEQFAKIDEHFAKIDGQFAKIDGQFADIRGQFANINGQFAEVKGQFAAIDKRFDAVDQQLDDAKIRDEKAHELLKFSLEAREGLRESMDEGFQAMGKKHNEEIALLKDVVRHITGTGSRR